MKGLGQVISERLAAKLPQWRINNKVTYIEWLEYLTTLYAQQGSTQFLLGCLYGFSKSIT